MTFDDIIRAEKLGLRGIQSGDVIYPKEPNADSQVIAQNISYNTGRKDIQGAVLFYQNPPLHSIDDKALTMNIEALEKIATKANEYQFLIVFGRNHPLHVGADIRENYTRLSEALEQSRMPDYLQWTDYRLGKFVSLSQLIDNISQSEVITVSIASGHPYGGSAEKIRMPDYVVTDSRMKLQLSEPSLGIMPVVGVYLLLRRTTEDNTRAITMTANPFTAYQLLDMEVVNSVIQIDGNYASPKNAKLAELEDDRTHGIIFPATLDFIVEVMESHDKLTRMQIPSAIDTKKLEEEIGWRTNPSNYERFSGMSLRDAEKQDGWKGRPLFKPSIEAIDYLLQRMNGMSFEELRTRRDELLKLERELDLGLYREHPKQIKIGFEAAINGTVPVFRTN